MKNILLFGAGKSATVLIDYLLGQAEQDQFTLTVVDANAALAKEKTGDSPFGKALSFDIKNEAERQQHIGASSLVISMLPPSLHSLVATDCLSLGRHLLTASYVDHAMRDMEPEIKAQGLLFLCEMGLDPGIDHMSAMKIIDEIKAAGGRIISFKSHCGGLVAPESDDNPWHYKISWNPRNIILAGKAGAVYKENGEEKTIGYKELFTTENRVEVPGHGSWGWYANRDSLSYIPVYRLEEAATFIRTTLRHPDFMYGWKNIVELKLTDETPLYETEGKSLQQLFKEHMDKNGFSEWISEKLSGRFSETKGMLENLMTLMQAEEEARNEGTELPESFMSADEKGNLQEMQVEDLKNKGAAFLAQKMHEANLTLKQLFFLGLDDNETQVNKGLCSAADILQFAAEKKLALGKEDKDMIIMLHEIEYEIENRRSEVKSSLVVIGEDSLHTAMAQTVGLPLGIAARLVLNGTVQLNGLHIPTLPALYEPVLKELEKQGVIFREITNHLS